MSGFEALLRDDFPLLEESGLTIHQLDLPVPSFCTLMNLLCRERLWRIEFWKIKSSQYNEWRWCLSNNVSKFVWNFFLKGLQRSTPTKTAGSNILMKTKRAPNICSLFKWDEKNRPQTLLGYSCPLLQLSLKSRAFLDKINPLNRRFYA